ncbi:MAG: uroporphyrinogen decarboxylase family protein, partial [Promethearchaeota archaeon]
ITYNNLKQYLNVNEGETKIHDMVQQLAIPEKWFLERFQIDSLDLARFFSVNQDKWKDWVLPNGSSAKIPNWIDIKKRDKEWICIDEDSDIVARMPFSSYYFEQTIWPLQGMRDVNLDNLNNYMKKVMWAHMSDPLWKNVNNRDFNQSIIQVCRNLCKFCDYVVMLGFGGSILGWGQSLYGMEDFLINLIIKKKAVIKFLDALLEIHLNNLEKIIEAVGSYVDIISFGDDLGTQIGPFISLDTYKDIILPCHKKLFQLVKRKSNMYVYLHSCGEISAFIPALIDAGVDILNPIQITTKGMEPKKLKKEYGKYISFWGGGIDTQNTLPRGTPNEVRDEVKKNCEIFMKDGGFVFTPVHNILADVPPENIIVMFDEVNRFRY